MNQQEVRHFVERYFSAFSTHILEAHPGYLSLKLPDEVDKDIGNRPFYWSWVEKMNLPPQPMILNLFFDPEQVPEGMRGEPIHFGSGRLQQIFQSTRKHGRFVCMYEHHPLLMQKTGSSVRRSTPLVPWLGINLKLSFICDKKRDHLLYLGVNLHQPRIAHDFYPFLQRLSLSPSIPDYFYTLDRRISLDQALTYVQQEAERVISRQDQRWAEEAIKRLEEELEILEGYYAELALREPNKEEDNREIEPDTDTSSEQQEQGILAEASIIGMGSSESLTKAGETQLVHVDQQQHSPGQSLGFERLNRFEQPLSLASEGSLPLEEHRSGGGRILDFLRMNGIQETPKAEIDQKEWRKSTPDEEKQRRMAELRWQYEPRIEISLINAGVFYLHNMPPFSADPLAK